MNLEKHRLEQAERTARIEQKQDTQTGLLEKIEGHLENQNGRLRKVEAKQSWFTGILFGIGSIGTIIGSYFKLKG